MVRRIVYVLLWLILASLPHATIGQPQPKLADAPAARQLLSITDIDNHGRTETIRADIQFDQRGRRVSNVVLDPREQMIGRESFSYDGDGKLVAREHHSADGKLKWRWQDFTFDRAGRPVRHNIINSQGKRIGWYVWHYDPDGRLTRRERFNADGTLRFYYGKITFDEQGNFATWTKFNGQGVKLGVKHWKYAPPE